MDTQALLGAYLAEPSLKAWLELYSKTLPGTGRIMGPTFWQAWIAVDGGAPTILAANTTFTTFPDAFTLRRGLRLAREGKVAVGLKALEAQHSAAHSVPLWAAPERPGKETTALELLKKGPV